MRFHVTPLVLLLTGFSVVCIAQPSATGQLRYAVMERFEADTITGVRDGRYRYFFDNRQLIEGYYTAGKKSGYWEYLDYRGMVRIKGFYKDDKRQGAWKYYYNGGKIATEINYEQDERHGSIKGYHPNGTLAMQGKYVHGVKDSVWIANDGKGLLKERTFYKNGLEDSVVEFYASGEIKKISTFDGENAVKETLFFKDGNVFSELTFKDGMFHNQRVLNISGASIKKGDFADGNGMLYLYYPPYDSLGEVAYSLQSVSNYTGGLANGAAETYDLQGKVLQRGAYQNGIKVGTWMVRDFTGKESMKDYKPSQGDTLSKIPQELLRTAEWNSTEHVQPEFPGGEQAMKDFLASVEYPPIAKENDMEGTIYIRFVIDGMGEVNDLEVAKGADLLLNKTALEHARKMPRWLPGFQGGLPATVQYIIPIIFRME